MFVDAFRPFIKKITFLGGNIDTATACFKNYNKSELTSLGLIDYECH